MHAIFRCREAQRFWNELPTFKGLGNWVPNLLTLFEFIQWKFSKSDLQLWAYTAAAVWGARNKRLFEGVTLEQGALLEGVERNLLDLRSALDPYRRLS